MTDSPSQSLSRRRPRNRWLVLIAAFKLLQALLYMAVGVGALRLLHKDVGEVLESLANHLRFNPESRFVNFILEKSSLIDDRLLRQIGEVVFIYAGLDLIEGTGLYLEKAWAEYLTLAITASFLPLELIRGIPQSDVDPGGPAGRQRPGVFLPAVSGGGTRERPAPKKDQEQDRRGMIRFLFALHYADGIYKADRQEGNQRSNSILLVVV